MKKFILFIWQLPQNILGLLVIFFTRAVKIECYYFINKCSEFGVSLGNFIVFGGYYLPSSLGELRHEQGHQKQSLYLGWLYLIVIGLPSIIGNIYDRMFHKKWDNIRRVKWYYNQPWEKWADKLGGVNRNKYLEEII